MSNKKDTNPKEALGIRKVPLHAVPVKPLLELGLAMLEGGRKYGSHNYREAGVRYSTYFDATIRHLFAWWEGEDIDPDSGLPHIVKIMADMTVLRDSQHMGNGVDDRPVQYPNGINMEEFNQKASHIIDKYPECAKGFYQKIEEVVPEPEPVPFKVSELKIGDTIILELDKKHTPEGLEAFAGGEEFTFQGAAEVGYWTRAKHKNLWLNVEESEIKEVKHVD